MTVSQQSRNRDIDLVSVTWKVVATTACTLTVSLSIVVWDMSAGFIQRMDRSIEQLTANQIAIRLTGERTLNLLESHERRLAALEAKMPKKDG